MWRKIVLWVVLVGCGFQSNAVPGDGSPGSRDSAVVEVDAASDPKPASDARVAGDARVTVDASVPVDAAVDAPPAPAGCLGQWLAGDPKIASPSELMALTTTGQERDPWISADGLTLYFSRDPQGSVKSDVVRASRSSTTQPFGNVVVPANLNTNANETRASLTADDRTLVLSSDRDGQSDIYLATRNPSEIEFPSPTTDFTANVNMPAALHLDPFLNADGTRLYLAPFSPPGQSQRIVVATRTSGNPQFSTPVAVAGIASPGANDADPAVTADERIIVFSSNRGGGGGGKTDLWYATRSDLQHDFGAPRPIPKVNGGDEDGDPMLSADGCVLYFASTRKGGGNYHLYTAKLTP